MPPNPNLLALVARWTCRFSSKLLIVMFEIDFLICRNDSYYLGPQLKVSFSTYFFRIDLPLLLSSSIDSSLRYAFFSRITCSALPGINILRKGVIQMIASNSAPSVGSRKCHFGSC